jgi:hypothetical protein
MRTTDTGLKLPCFALLGLALPYVAPVREQVLERSSNTLLRALLWLIGGMVDLPPMSQLRYSPVLQQRWRSVSLFPQG